MGGGGGVPRQALCNLVYGNVYGLPNNRDFLFNCSMLQAYCSNSPMPTYIFSYIHIFIGRISRDVFRDCFDGGRIPYNIILLPCYNININNILDTQGVVFL